MIELTDAAMVAWLTDVVDPVAVTLGPPPVPPVPPGTAAGVACHLLALIPSPTPRGATRPPVQAVARYLVTSWAPSPSDAHRLLGEVLVAAADRADVDLEQSEPSTDLWPALGIAPQPALVVRVPVRWPRPESRAPLVRRPVRLDWLGMRPLTGVVVAPSGVPIARAQLRLPHSDGAVWTGPDGAFTFPAVPSSSATSSTGDLAITVSARGITRTVAVTPTDGPHLTIVFDPEEQPPCPPT